MNVRVSPPLAKPTLPDVPLPLLVTGVAGVAGYNAFRYFQQRHPGQVVGTRRADNWRLSGPGIAACDIHDRDALRRLFDRYAFASVLHAEGTCKLKSCELDPSLARQVNVDGLANLLEHLDPETRLVHLSVDLVFSGTRAGNHREDDPTDPVTVYGRSMAEAEQLLLARHADSCILRISLPMGVSFNGHAGAIDWIQSRFKKQKPATLYFDEIRTPTYTDCLNRVFHATLAGTMRGLFHAGGPRRLSLYQIAQIVNRVGGYDPRHLQGCLRHEAGPIPPRAGDVSLDSSRLAAALGFAPFDPWPVADQWVPTHREWHFERPADQAGSPELLAELLYRNPRG
ncbi:MAG: sugar nucleotide-binding protein [Pirellulales bacterium]